MAVLLSGLYAADRCADLRALTNFDASVISAILMPKSGSMPEYCLVNGQILPEVRFEIDLPTEWSGRLLTVGNGGYAGESLDSPQRYGQRLRALSRGFALAATNTGHDGVTEPLGTFATNSQKLIDYAFRAVHVTTLFLKQAVQTYYGRAAGRSYFEGCSTGGRQGLIEAQRFPQDFDGIVAGAPVLNFSGTMVSYAWMLRALAASPIDTRKLKLLADKVYEHCDAADGLKDGLIDDPRHCDFAPRRDLPPCAEGADNPDCFTSGQIAALEAIYGGTQSRGKPYFPGMPLGSEGGWSPWIVRENGPTIGRLFGETFFRFLAFPKPDPNYDISKFDFDKDPPRLEAIHKMLDAMDADLSAFKARHGKLIMYFGWADPALNPMMGVTYYESVLKTMGESTGEFFRLFMVPGMYHCGGGVGPDRFDAFQALTDWVERGTAPDQIRAARVAGRKEVRTRPLCPYPQSAVYKGSGSIDDAQNFSCQVRQR